MEKLEHFHHCERTDAKKLKTIDLMSFLMGFSQSILVYIMSSYFKEASGTENVGFFYFISYLVVLILLLNFHKIIRKFGKFNVFSFVFIFKIFIIAGLAIMPASVFGSLFLMLYIILASIGWTTLDIILESCSTDKKSGRIRGLYLTIINAGFIFGPFISSKLIENTGFHIIFAISLIFHIAEYLIAHRSLSGANHEHQEKETIKQLLFRALKRINIVRVYYISFVLDFFYAVMVVFSPLYLLSIGMEWNQIGIVFTIMLIPFVAIQYPVGVLADKNYGEKNFLIASLFLMGLSVFSIYFIKTNSTLVWALVMFATRVGASVLEIMRDSYFYKRIDGNDIDLIDFFRTSRPVAYVLATLASTILLFCFSMQSVFLFLVLVIIIGLYPAFRLDNNSVSKED